MRLKMCSIHVKDPAAAFEFYTGILGFESLMAMPEHNLYIVKDPAGSGGGSVGLLLEPSDNPIGAAYMNGCHDAGLPAIVFGVTDVRAEFKRLTAKGVMFQGEPSVGPGGRRQCSTTGAGTSSSSTRTEPVPSAAATRRRRAPSWRPSVQPRP